MKKRTKKKALPMLSIGEYSRLYIDESVKRAAREKKQKALLLLLRKDNRALRKLVCALNNRLEAEAKKRAEKDYYMFVPEIDRLKGELADATQTLEITRKELDRLRSDMAPERRAAADLAVEQEWERKFSGEPAPGLAAWLKRVFRLPWKF